MTVSRAPVLAEFGLQLPTTPAATTSIVTVADADSPVPFVSVTVTSSSKVVSDNYSAIGDGARSLPGVDWRNEKGTHGGASAPDTDLADPGDAEFMCAFHRIHDPDYRQLILDMVKGLNRVGNGKALDGQGNGDEVGHWDQKLSQHRAARREIREGRVITLRPHKPDQDGTSDRREDNRHGPRVHTVPR